MRVLHLLQSDRFSGAENVVCQIISMFKYDTNIEMVYCSRDGQIRDALKERGIRFFPMSKLCVSEAKRVIKEYKPNIIHAHDFTASVIASFVAGKIPVISHLHNNSPWIQKYCINSFIYGLSCYKYKKIFTVSDSVFDEFVFGNKFRHKLQVVGNPINIQSIIDRSNEYSCNENYDVGFCGRLAPPKNPLFFLEVLNDLVRNKPNLRAIMIGDGEMRDSVEEQISKLNLKSNVKLLGFVKNPYPIMKKCKVMCMPSVWEGFGLAAVESLSLGTPVICSNVGGLPSIVNNECGHICKNKNDYIEQITSLLDNPTLLSKMSKNASDRMAQFDNTGKYKNALCKTYRRCITS